MTLIVKIEFMVCMRFTKYMIKDKMSECVIKYYSIIVDSNIQIIYFLEGHLIIDVFVLRLATTIIDI